MKVTLESTTQIVTTRDGTRARLWEGRTESGIAVHALVAEIAVSRAADNSEFERELSEHADPSAEGRKAYDLRLFVD